MAIRIRSLGMRDYESVIRLLDLAGLHPLVRGRESRSAYDRQLRSNRGRYLGAFEGTALVGVVFGTHDSRKGWINRLAVDPGHRRRGIATRLVRACEAAWRREGIQVYAALVEPGNAGSSAFFEELGYETTQIVYVRRKLRERI